MRASQKTGSAPSAIAIACAVATALFALQGDSSGLPVVGSTITLGLAALAALLIALRLIDPPGGEGVGLEAGAWLGLILAIGLAFASRGGMSDRAV